MIGRRTPAQLAQQLNRHVDGRYAEQQLADPGSQVLVDSDDLIRRIATSSDPLHVQLSMNAAAAVLRDQDPDLAERLEVMAVTQTEQVTVLVADSNSRSLYLVEGRVAEAEDDTLAMWPKGLRARGFRFPLTSVCAVRDGYGRSDDLLHDLARTASNAVPQLADDPMLEWLPPYTAERHDTDDAPIAACYLLRHRESSDQPFTHGCVLAATAADDSYVYGYLWAPAGSGIRSRFVRTNPARVATMAARIANYQSGRLTVGSCEDLPADRSAMYQQLGEMGLSAA